MRDFGRGVARCPDHGVMYRTREPVSRFSQVLAAGLDPVRPDDPLPVAGARADCPQCGRDLNFDWEPEP